MPNTPDIVTIGNAHLAASVSALGAEMQSLTFGGQPLLWHGDSTFWSGRSPVLFPIVGRAADDLIAVNGRSAVMAQHGFARRSTFELLEATAEACAHRLAASDATRAVYPFEFCLTLRHVISDAGLRVSALVENHDTVPMPFGIGFHPAFLWPLPGAAGQAHRVRLDNGAEPPLVRLSGGLLGPARKPSPFRAGALTLAPEQFQDDAMIFPEGAGRGLSYGADTGPALKFRFENLPNLALWTKPGAPFICIEPWHGMAAEHGAGPEIAARPFSVILAPGEAAEFAFSISVA